MEQLSISLWFTLFIWSFFTLAAIINIVKESDWRVHANMLVYTIGLPAIAILLEYLIIR